MPNPISRVALVSQVQLYPRSSTHTAAAVLASPVPAPFTVSISPQGRPAVAARPDHDGL